MNKKVSNYIKKEFILFIIGGIVYYIIEVLYRGYSHWTMAIVGGLAFIFIGLLNEFYTFEMYIETQAIISSIFITIIEFIAGYIINIKLGWNVWDYSNLPFNIMGQVCLLFTFFWILLSIVGIYLDDIIRYFLFDEKKPVYKSFISEKIRKE